MLKAKKGEICLGKRGMRGEKEREGVGKEESFEDPSESPWLKVITPNIATGYRLGLQRLATGN